MSVMLTRPTSGVASSGTGVDQITQTILASATVNVDTLPVATTRAVKWIVTLTNTTSNEVRSFEVLAMHRNGANPTHNTYSVLGDNVSHTLDVKIVATDLVLEITNNEAVSIVVDAARVVTYV